MNLTNNFIIDVTMLSVHVVLQICRIYVLHQEATFVAFASNPLLAPVGGEGVASVLVVDAGSIGLLCLGLLSGGFLVTDAQVRLGWSLGSTGAAGGLTVQSPMVSPESRREAGDT